MVENKSDINSRSGDTENCVRFISTTVNKFKQQPINYHVLSGIIFKVLCCTLVQGGSILKTVQIAVFKVGASKIGYF